VGSADPVDRNLDHGHAVRTVEKNLFRGVDNGIGQQAVGRVKQERGLVAVMKDLADCRQIPSEVRLAAGERDPQDPPQGTCNRLDFGKGQFFGLVWL